MANKAEEFVAWLNALERDWTLIDFGPVLEQCLDLLREEVQQNFDSSTSPEGAIWPPRKDNLPHPLLIKTKRMMQSTVNKDHAEHIEGVSRNGAIFGTSVEYAPFHQEGIGVPIRKFLGASEELRDKFTEMIADFLEKKLLEMFDNAGTGVA